jgi:hypothetical protein
MTDPIASMQEALATATPSEQARKPLSLDPLHVDAERTNKKGVPYAPGAARGYVVALGMDEDGNAYFAVPTYETIRLNPDYAQDNERMQELVEAAASKGLHDVAVRSGREISGTNANGAWSFRPKFVAEIRKADDVIEG